MKSNHTSEPEYTAQEIMQILANAIGCGIAILGTDALLEGYENEDEEQKRHGLDMVLVGSNIAALGPDFLRLGLPDLDGSDQ